MYRVKCETCDATQDIFRKMSEYDLLPMCPCGGVTHRVICAPAVHAAFDSYISPASSKLIESRTQQREDLYKTGHILSEPGLRQDIARNKAAVQEAAFAPIAAGVDAAVSRLVQTGKIES